MIDLAKGMSKPHHYIRLTKESRADLQAWYAFIQNFNGRAMLLVPLDMVLFIRLIGCMAFGVNQMSSYTITLF